MSEDNLLKTEEAISETEVPVGDTLPSAVEDVPEKATPVVEVVEEKPAIAETTADKPSSAEATADKHDDSGVDDSPDASLQAPQREKIGSKDTGSFANASSSAEATADKHDDKGVGNEATADRPSSAEATADKSTSAEATADSQTGSVVKPEAGIPFIQKVWLYLGELRKRANLKRKAQLEKNLEIILTEAWKTETITNNDVERVTGASDRQALNYLKELVKRGKLMRFGKGRNIHYKPLR